MKNLCIIKRIRERLEHLNSLMCPKCGRMSLEHSHSWIGGWNNLCEQAAARSGRRCFDCGHMVWDQTDEEYKENLKDWCTPYC